MLRRELLELGHEQRVFALCEACFGALFDGDESQLLEPRDLALGERLECDIGERRSAPPRKGVVELPARLGRRVAAARHRPFEPPRIDRLRVDGESIARSDRLDCVGCRAERASQTRHGDLQAPCGHRGCGVRPQRLADRLRVDRLRCVEGQERQERPLSAGGDGEHRAVEARLDRTEDCELHLPTLRL